MLRILCSILSIVAGSLLTTGSASAQTDPASPVPVDTAPTSEVAVPSTSNVPPPPPENDEPKVAVHGQYRIRFLANGGQDFANGNPNETVAHRARLRVDATVSDEVSARISVQDVRRWGEELSTVGDFSADGMDVHEAWMQYKRSGVTVRAGRQVINLDGQRLVGGLDWADQARSFDALRIMYEQDSIHAEGFWSKLREEDAPSQTADSDVDFGGFYARYDGTKIFKPALYALYERDSSADKDRFTVGTHITSKPVPGLTLNGEFYYQLGSIGAGAASSDYSAFLAAVRAEYAIDHAAKPTFAAWFEYISGDDDLGDDKIKAFDTLFGTNHKFYGFMDFFLNIPVHTANLGLVDIGGRAKVSPTKDLSAFVDYHHFRFAQDSAEGATAGHEVDLILNYKVDKRLKLQGGFSLFLPDEAITCVRFGSCNPDPEVEGFGYLMANMTF